MVDGKSLHSAQKHLLKDVRGDVLATDRVLSNPFLVTAH